MIKNDKIRTTPPPSPRQKIPGCLGVKLWRLSVVVSNVPVIYPTILKCRIKQVCWHTCGGALMCGHTYWCSGSIRSFSIFHTPAVIFKYYTLSSTTCTFADVAQKHLISICYYLLIYQIFRPRSRFLDVSRAYFCKNRRCENERLQWQIGKTNRNTYR